MYEELVKRLRDISNSDSNIKSNNIGLTMLQAAGAIEELQASEKKFLRNISALEMENENLKRAGRWIPVTERLPEVKQEVLCACRAGIFEVLKYVNGSGGPWYKDSRHVYMSGFVTHWMPLPTPPKEET